MSPPVPSADGRERAGVLRAAVMLLAIGVLASWLVIALAHADDRYNVGWVEGTRMALARSAGSGELFPPLYDGERYGGTRFMPVPILVHAGVAGLTNEYLSSGKLVAYLSTAVLLGLTFLILRRMNLGTAAAMCLTAGVLATRPGLLAGTTIQGDALPVFFQLGAVASIATFTERRWTVAAAALCVLAIASKLSAVWAPLAIVVWLVLRDRRRIPLFLGTLVPLLVGMFAVLYLVTEGRIVSNLSELSFAGVGGASDVLRSPLRALELALDGAPALVILAPLALFGEPLIAGRSGLSIYFVSLLCAVATLLVVLSDRGTTHNHLIDVTVLTFIVVGRVWSSATALQTAVRWAPAIVGIVVVWAIAVSAVTELARDARQAAGSLLSGGSDSPSEELAGLVGPNDSLLAEDPFVPVALGRTPTVLDPWVLLRVGREHPGWIADLTARIRAHRFDKILLIYPLSFRAWYEEIHLGEPVAEAIRESYRLTGSRAGYYVYVPAVSGSAADRSSGAP